MEIILITSLEFDEFICIVAFSISIQIELNLHKFIKKM